MRGRYTLPWEYFIASEPRPYIKEWLAEANKSYLPEGRRGARRRAVARSPTTSAWCCAIVLLACLSRLLVLPFSLKAERDQIRARAAAAEMDDIKSRLKDDPVRKTRAIRAFYKRHGITPAATCWRMLFLPIMAVALLAVQDLAAQSNGGLPLDARPRQRDPWLILPLVFGVLITLYIDLAFATIAHASGSLIWIVALPLLTATGALLGAGADIYLIASAALLVVQRLWVSGEFERLWQAWRRSRHARRASSRSRTCRGSRTAATRPTAWRGCARPACRCRTAWC